MNTDFAGSAYRHFLAWGVLASLALTVCTIVDATLVGNLVGPRGLAVANISTPVFLLYALLGITIAVGANVHIARQLGASDTEGANRTFHSALGLGVTAGVLALSPLLLRDTYFSFLGVTEELYPLAEQYLTVVMWSAPIFVLYHILSFSVRSDSDPRLSAIASGVVITTNIVLDILFMKVLGWGIAGASASLCIAEALGTAVLLTHFAKKHSILKLRLSLPSKKDVRDFVSDGFGMGSANIFGAAVMLAFNTMLLRNESSGALYVAIYGVIYTIGTIPAGIFDGASSALSAVTAFLTGESDRDGIAAVLKKALTVAVASAATLTILSFIFSHALARCFGIRDDAAAAMAAGAIGIYSLCLVFAGINSIVTAFWQSIGRAKEAAVMSILRNCLLLLAAGSFLIPRFSIMGLSFSYLTTEAVCCLGALIMGIVSPSGKYIGEKYRDSGRSMERIYPMDTESMARIDGDLEGISEEWDMDIRKSFVINFICEEILLNIIKFGLSDTEKKKKEYYISIKLIERGDETVLRIRDNVSTYNPFESMGDEIDRGVLELIRKKTKYCDYQRKMIFNYLYLIL